MLVYDNSPKSRYEEIKSWYPTWYRRFAEMDALWSVYGDQLQNIQDEIVRLIDNNFIDYADEEAVYQYELFLNINYTGYRTLEDRRKTIKALLIGNGHFGRKEIIDIVSTFTDGEVEVGFKNGIIKVIITSKFGSGSLLIDCWQILERQKPAHLKLQIYENIIQETHTPLYMATGSITNTTYTSKGIEPTFPEDYIYSIDNNEATLLYYTGTFTRIEIPSYIGGFPVTTIEATCFNYREDINMVEIPNTVKNIR